MTNKLLILTCLLASSCNHVSKPQTSTEPDPYQDSPVHGVPLHKLNAPFYWPPDQFVAPPGDVPDRIFPGSELPVEQVKVKII